ncbi:MAG: TonB-dependent receptor domain-containing protein [Gammaproteobacteria bacterium]
MRSIAAGVSFGFLVASPSHADPAAGSDTSVPAPFDEIVVTATRTEIPRDRSLAPVIVIGREEIERSLAIDVAELLRFHAGLEIGRSGGPGQATSLFIRGADSNHTLVLLDGVEINPGTLGGAALQNVSPDVVERIEIVKGPRSSLYGSEAIGGVVNIITREAGPGRRFTAGAGGGRYGTGEASFTTGIDGERTSLDISAAWLSTDGFPTLSADDIDRGYDQLSVNLDAGLSIGPFVASLRHWQAEGTNEYSDFFARPVDQDYANRATAVELAGRATGVWRPRLNLSRAVDDIEQNQSADFVTTRRDALDWQNDLALGDAQLVVAGLYVSREETSSISFGAPLEERAGKGRVDTDVRALFVEDHIELGRHGMLLAARYTDHETFGTETTWNAEYGFQLGADSQLTLGAGTGFRAPDSIDRFGFGGNPDLDPERSRNFEVGLRHALDAHQRLSLSLFHNEIDDLIEFMTISSDPFIGENRNIEKARIRGIEAGYELRGELWRFRAAATVQDPENVTDGMRLLRRARRNLTFSVGRGFGPHELGLDVLASGDREDFGSSMPAELGGYVLANLTGRFTLTRQWSLRAKLENLLDAEYETVNGFNSAGRGLYILLELDL